MDDFQSVPSVVVGVDGSRAATQAALWAVDEAVSRDIPLRLIYAIDPADLCGAGLDQRQFAAARTARYDAQRAVEVSGQPVKIETEVTVGTPLAALARESRSAVMLCVGSLGIKHACRGTGIVAAALPQLARCPVAVIEPAHRPPVTAVLGRIVVEVDNGVVLRHAFEEARLRDAPLRAVASSRAAVPDDAAEAYRWPRAQLNRRIAAWSRLYPDVVVESLVVHGSVCGYLASNAESVQLFVTGARGRSCHRRPGFSGWSILTVGGNHL